MSTLLRCLEAIVKKSLLSFDHNVGLHEDFANGLLLSACLVVLVWSCRDIEAASSLLELHAVFLTQWWVGDSLIACK